MNTRTNSVPTTQDFAKPSLAQQNQMARLLVTVDTLAKRVQSLEGEIACLVAVVNSNNRCTDRPRLIL